MKVFIIYNKVNWSQSEMSGAFKRRDNLQKIDKSRRHFWLLF